MTIYKLLSPAPECAHSPIIVITRADHPGYGVGRLASVTRLAGRKQRTDAIGHPVWFCKGSLSSRRALIKTIGLKTLVVFDLRKTAQQPKYSGGFQNTNMQLTMWGTFPSY